MNRFTGVMAVAGLAFTLAACAPTTQTVKPGANAGMGATGSSAMGSGSGQGQANALQGQGAMSASQLNNPASPLYKRTIYFAFNSSAIAPQYLTIISAHAKYLSAHPNTTIKLEGNTDDRGSHTYNMALGQRRAQAVAKLLELQGVKASQLDIISYGEDNPVCMQQNEACWQQNRRVNLVYPGQPATMPAPTSGSSTTMNSQSGMSGQ
ncbi:peptidoglycan-associated lipoprotein Pal [Acidihalobacter aeolianus]|nr:peptidoglycan-associated lipoprotein Pal [Acidihalobacter aeolianus]